MEKILIGTVLKPHGIKGELKIKYFADSFASIKNCKVVFIDGKEYKVTKLKLDSGDFAFLGLDGVIDRNMSELFRNKEVYALKSQIVKSKTAFFISDLKGLKVYVNGEIFGEVTDVLQSNVDMFCIELINGKIAYLPYLKSLNLDVNIEEKSLKIVGDDYEKVIFYEN